MWPSPQRTLTYRSYRPNEPCAPPEADEQRRETFDKPVRALVDNQLRAGADASRADAELARARVNLGRAQQKEKISRAALADILGLSDTSVEVQEGSLREFQCPRVRHHH
jgi:outer membrane protein TolC